MGTGGKNQGVCRGHQKPLLCSCAKNAEKMLTVKCTVWDPVLSLLLVIFTSAYVLT